MESGSDSDAENDVLALGEDFVASPTHKAAGITRVDFDGMLDPPLQLQEDLTNGCGGQLWPAGMVLTKYALRQPVDMFAGKRILELGAGGGLVGLALAMHLKRKLGSSFASVRVDVTDQENMYPLMHTNIRLNGLPESIVHASVLDWGTTIESPQPEIILAADCVYFEPAFPLLLQTMKDLIGANTICLFCFKKRRRADLRFIKDAKKSFLVQDITDDPDRQKWSREGLFLYKITKR